MLRQLIVVLQTYVTRPMVWTIGGIYLLILSASVLGIAPRSQAVYPEDSGNYQSTLHLEGSKAVHDFELKNFSRQIAKVQIRWYLADSTLPHGERRIRPASLRSLRECKNLKSLQIKHEGELSEEELQAISELQQLTRVSLHGVKVTHYVWTYLQRLPKLQYLNLSGCVFDGPVPQLESMSPLQTLILGTPEHGGVRSRGASFFGELRRIPNLKTIVLGDYHNSLVQDSERGGFHRVAHPLLESIDAIRGITTLQTLYVNEHSQGFPGFADLQANLPGVAVRPAFVDVRRISWIFTLVLLNATVLALIALQFRSHFAHPGAHLIPSYTWPHFVPPLILWIGSIVSIIPLLIFSVPIIPAIGIHAASWASMTGIAIISTQLQWIARWPRWISNPASALTGAVLGGLLPLMLLGIYRFPSSVDWYLRGNEPWIAFILITLGTVLPLFVAYQYLRIYSNYLENRLDSPDLGLSIFSNGSVQQRAYQGLNIAAQPRWLQWILSVNLESVISKSRNGGWLERCRLWIAGNALSGRAMMLLVAIGTLLFVPMQVIQFGFTDYQNDLGALVAISAFVSKVGPLFFLIPDFGLIFFLNQWRVRRSLFGMELLRPNSRKEFIRQIMSAIAWDLIPQGCIYLSLFAMLLMLADATRITIGLILAMLLVTISRWVLVYAIVVWLLLIRRGWLMVLTAVFAVYGLLCVNVGMLMLQASILGVQNLPSDLPDFGVGMVAAIAMMMGLIGVTLAALAYFRWQRVELA